MFVDMSEALLVAKVFNVGLKDDLNEGNCHGEDEPDVNHLDVGGLGKVVAHSDVHRHQDQHDGQVDSYDRLKVESLKVDGGVSHDVEENGGKKHGQQVVHESASQGDVDL